MKRGLIFSALLLAAAVSSARAQVASPIVNAAPEQKQIIPKIADGGIPPVVGVQNVEIFRATTKHSRFARRSRAGPTTTTWTWRFGTVTTWWRSPTGRRMKMCGLRRK